MPCKEWIPSTESPNCKFKKMLNYSVQNLPKPFPVHSLTSQREIHFSIVAEFSYHHVQKAILDWKWIILNGCNISQSCQRLSPSNIKDLFFSCSPEHANSISRFGLDVWEGILVGRGLEKLTQTDSYKTPLISMHEIILAEFLWGSVSIFSSWHSQVNAILLC